MQSIFPLSWCTDRIAPKMQTGKAVLDNMRTSPVVEIPMLNRLKRKKTDGPEPLSPIQLQSNKKPRPESESVSLAQACLPAQSEQTIASLHAQPMYAKMLGSLDPQATALQQQNTTAPQPAGSAHVMNRKGTESPAAPPPSSSDVAMKDAQPSIVADPTDLTPLQQVIENEFNMQILVKHNELRLIEQELAKCQVALEQLRRCELQPYPGGEQPAESVSTGTGFAIAPPSGYTRPSHPAPHGVIDGPYSRHYRQWLLHDPQFDAMPAHMHLPMESSMSGVIRSTRYNGTARKTSGRPFVVPGRNSDALQSIPNYPAPAPKDKSAPLVLRRSTDGQLVKLICNNCQRGNFSSIQGFLNHCRIAHKVDYKSHDAAAVDCGRPLDEHEAANLPPETQHAPPPKPMASRSSSVVSTPLKNLVHPMNMVNGAPIPPSIPIQSSARPVKANTTATAAAPRLPQTKGSVFKPSAQAPRLSAHFAKYHIGGDLEEAITNAKQKVESGADEDVVSPGSFDPMSPAVPLAGTRTVAGAGRAGALVTTSALGRPPSRKGHREPAQRHRPTPLAPAPLKQEHGEIPESPQDHSSNLSPHTADSNPGLVSDHEDDDHGSASEDEVPQAAIPHSFGVGRNGCTDNMDIDVAVDDTIDEHGVVIRRNSMLATEDRAMRAAGSPSRKLGASHQGA